MATIPTLTFAEQVKKCINDWCNLEPANSVSKKKRQKYVICILDTLHDFYENPVKINNVSYTKPDIVLKWANHYFLYSGIYCPLTGGTGGLVANIQLNIQQLNYVGGNATTIGKELLFEWWDQTKVASNIKYCRESFNRTAGTGTNTNKGIFVSRRQKKSFSDLTTIQGSSIVPLLVFSDQGVPKNPFKLSSGNYVNRIGIGGLYDKNTHSSNTSDIFVQNGYTITLSKGDFEGVLGYDSVTISNAGDIFILNYQGNNFTRNIDDTNLKHAKTQFRQYANTPAAPTVKFFTDWLNNLSVVGNIGNILKTAIQTGTISNQVFEYLSLIFDLKRLGDWSQSYELRILSPLNMNSIFNTVDGIAAGCAVYFQEIATLLWKKTTKRSQGFELYNYNKEINCVQIKNGDITGSPPSYPNYAPNLHPDEDFPDVNTLNVAFSNLPLMGGTGKDDELLIACMNEWTNNTYYYVELLMCRGDLLGREGRGNKEINNYAIRIRDLCDADIKRWVEKTQDGLEEYFKQYLEYVKNIRGASINLKDFLKERFKPENDDTPDNDEAFYITCLFSLFKYEFDKLTSDKLTPDNSKQNTEDIYSSIEESCSSSDTFETLTLFAKFLSYQLLRDTIIDFLNPVYDFPSIPVYVSDDSFNTRLTLNEKYELIMYMIAYELTKNDDERFIDLYNYDKFSSSIRNPKRGADDSDGEFQSIERAEKDRRTSGGKNVKNLDKLKKPIIKPKTLEKQPKDKLKKPIIKPKTSEKQPKDKLKKPIIKPKTVTNIENYNISKYKLRIEQFKNKGFSAYFENKIRKHLNDKNINIYKIGIMKMRGILKDIYKTD
jgi:hypothetical protein